MKLTPAQSKIIALTQLDPDMPMARMRTKLGFKDHTIRYALERAREQGIIEQRYFVNLFRLGYLQHEVFFSLSSEERGAREKLLAQLIKSDRISWIGRLGGDYHYGMNVCSRHMSEMMGLFDQLSTAYGKIFLEKALSLRIGLTFYGNRYLAPRSANTPPLSYRITPEFVEIDDVDHRILSTLTSHANISIHSLARILGIPQSTADYRVKKLKKSGVIVGSYYHVKLASTGVQSFLCLISTKGISGIFRERALKFCDENPEIVLLIESVGSWDFEFVVDVMRAEDAMKLSEKLLDYFGPDIRWIKMIPLFSYPKVKEYPFST